MEAPLEREVPVAAWDDKVVWTVARNETWVGVIHVVQALDADQARGKANLRTVVVGEPWAGPGRPEHAYTVELDHKTGFWLRRDGSTAPGATRAAHADDASPDS